MWSFAAIAASKTATLGTEEITLRRHNLLVLAAALAIAFAGPVAAGQSSEPKVKVLANPVDAFEEKHGVRVGSASAGGMLIRLELEFGRGMRMPMGSPTKWMKHSRLPGELSHVEVKPTAWPVPHLRPRRDGIWKRHHGNRQR